MPLLGTPKLYFHDCSEIKAAGTEASDQPCDRMWLWLTSKSAR